MQELYLELEDTEWPKEYTDHDRNIVRAIVYDNEGYLYFMKVQRDDEFGTAELIETSGGGMEEGEDEKTAVLRELSEELGVNGEIIVKIGIVSDYYNLIHRHNLNHYYLVHARSFGKTHMTADEIDCFHLSALRLTLAEAEKMYHNAMRFPLGRLLANRELPVLHHAAEWMKQAGLNLKESD
ncbi:MAG: NUDIX hydrolase [Solobacterium sp.]|nr:NUDIX hydrolase [Solobacterium sp.]